MVQVHSGRLPIQASKLVLLLAVVLMGVVGLLSSGVERAGASQSWCADDPVIRVNGQLISVTVNVPTSQVGRVQGAEVVFHVPVNVSASVVYVGQTYFPETAVILFDQPAWDGVSKMKVPVDVLVRASGSFPIAVETLDATGTKNWTDGEANERLTVKTLGYVRAEDSD